MQSVHSRWDNVWLGEPSRRIRNGLPPLGLEVCGGHPDLPFTARTRDGFPDFDGGQLLVFVDYVFEFGAEPALRHGGSRHCRLDRAPPVSGPVATVEAA